MTQAILITAYKDVQQLKDLISFFDNGFKVYVHYDKKYPLSISEIEELKSLESTTYVCQKYKVNWGGFNHLRAYLHLAKIALEDGQNRFFHLVTAQDYPIKNLDHFKEFFRQQLDDPKDYLLYNKLPYKNWAQGGLNRLEYYHLYDHINPSKHKRLIRRLVRLQQSIGIKRPKIKCFEAFYGGSTYWTLSRETLKYVVGFTDQNPKIFQRFKHTFCAEEIYFQTVIMNSKYKERVVNDNLRYIDWTKGRGSTPVVLDERDFDNIIRSKFLFARKFDKKSKQLKQMFKNELLKNSKWEI